MKQVALRVLPPRAQHWMRVGRTFALGKGPSHLLAGIACADRTKAAIDVGANMGVYAWALARNFPRVIAIEPHPGCAAYLRAVLPANCTLHEVALSDRTGTAVLRTPASSEGEQTGFSTVASENDLGGDPSRVAQRQVVTTTLDELVLGEQPPVPSVGLIKIDVEGHELAVVKGARDLLTRDRPVLLVETEYRHGAPVAELFGFLEQLGYAGFVVRGAELVPTDADGLRRIQDGDGTAGTAAGSEPINANNVVFRPKGTT